MSGKIGISLALALGAFASLDAGVARAEERPYLKVGPWQILDIDDGGRFSRCSASITTRSGMVRLHRMAGGAWMVSIPRGDVPKGASTRGEIDVGRSSEPVKITADMADRASFALTPGLVEAFKALGPLRVRVDARTYTWDLQNTGAALGAIDECRTKALRR